MSGEFIIPEADVVYLIPIDLSNLLKRYNYDVSVFLKILKEIGKIDDYYIPADIKERPQILKDMTDDNKLFFASDIDYFEEDYLSLKRFGRADLRDFQIKIRTNSTVLDCKIKPYLTVFNVGVGIYTFWIRRISNATKNDVIDLCFINKITVLENGKKERKVIDFIIDRIGSLFNNNIKINKEDLLENMLTMIFIKNFPFESENLPYDFIETYKGHIFDILTLPERYYGKTYDYHKTRTREYIDQVLRNISVRHDFPVFVSNNRFLGIKIMTEKPIEDYDFMKRIIFNIVLYSNAVLQLRLLKNINSQLSNIIKNPKQLSIGRLVSMREAIFRDLEEYINTRIQRYEIWRKAMEDAAAELGIPELYKATQERLEMLNMYIQTAYQKASNVLFIVLNSLVIISAVIEILSYFFFGISLAVALSAVIVSLLIWVVISYKYFAMYLR